MLQTSKSNRWFLLLVVCGLLGLLAIWGALRAALTAPRYGDATGVAGELLAGHRVGQTFVAQHDGLDGVDLLLATYAHANPGSVVLHLRRDVAATADLAMMRLPAAAVVNNAWQHFAFPPQAGSRGQAFYIELEHPGAVPGQAITAYWALGRGDPYPYGRATYDRAPLDGDLAFGLHYDPPPDALLADLRAALVGQIPGAMRGVLVGGVLAGAGLLALLIAGAARGAFAGSGWRQALVGGLLGAFALAHGAVYMAAVPPWQGPDEFAHYAYTVLLAVGVEHDDMRAPALAVRDQIERRILAAMDARGFTRTVGWYPDPGGPAAAFVHEPVFGTSTMFAETRQPPLYYRVAAWVLRAAAPDPVAIPPDIGLYLVRGTSVFWGALAVLAAWGVARLLAPGPRFRLLGIALPLAVTLQPMRAFVDSTANNDVLAEAGVALEVLGLVAWLTRRRPLAWPAILLPILAAGPLALSVAAKTSTAAVPAGMLWLGAWIGVVLIQGEGVRNQESGAGITRHAPRATRSPFKTQHSKLNIRLRVVGALVLIGAMGLLATGFEWDTAAGAWFHVADARPAARALSPDAHDGASVLSLAPGDAVYQLIDLPAGHAAYQATLRLWVRPAPGIEQATITVRFETGGPLTGTVGVAAGPPGPAGWQPITATARLGSEVAFVRAVVRADAPSQADDAWLQVARGPEEGGALVPDTAAWLRNPSLEAATVHVQPDSPLGRVLAGLPPDLRASQILETLANPAPFDKVTTARAYLDNAFRSYWGWFGWLGPAQQLPAAQYAGLGLLGVLALGGWLVGLGRWLRPARPLLVLGGLAAFAFAAAVLVSVARQMMLWAVLGFRDFPQGRYLFVLMVPTTWWLLAGLSRWPALLGRRAPQALRWAAGLGFLALLFLDLYALLVLIIPYYYGRF